MDEILKGKLTRFLLHYSHDFLFGLPEGSTDYSKGRQKRIYDNLREKGKKLWGDKFNFIDKPYDDVTSQLLSYIGIERLIKDFIIPTTMALFSEDLLNSLKTYWLDGTKPNESFLIRYRLNRETASPFLDVSEFEYEKCIHRNVNSWGDFAWFWFEEIEPEFKEYIYKLRIENK